MPEPPFGARRPRAVADVPPPALADGHAVAKGWLLALVAQRPLGEAGAIPVAELAAEGPALCAAALRAVGSDAGLERLVGGEAAPAARAGDLAGAHDAKATVAAVAALRAALWEALVATMAPLDQPTTAALAERLAHVCDAVSAACLAAARPSGAPAFHVRDARRPRLVEVRDGWRQALHKGLEDHAREGPPLALLALEIDDARRLLASDDAAEAGAAALARAEGAVRGALASGEVLDREGDGRLWIVARGAGAASARTLAQRLADAVTAGGPVRGAALTVSIGVASCPPDAADADALAALADERLFAARAAGVPIA